MYSFAKFLLLILTLNLAISPIQAQTSEGSNGLYFRQSKSHKIKWLPYTSATLAQASKDNKQIIIDIGTVWSRPSQQGAFEVFQDDKVVSAISDGFVAIKVDADEMPDVARRFAAAYEILNQKDAALPLTVFALPNGLPFDVMGALPAVDADGQIGLSGALEQARKLYLERKEDAVAQSEKLVAAIASRLNTAPAEAADRDLNNPDLLSQGAATALYALGKPTGDQATAASAWLLELYKSKARDHILGGYFATAGGESVLIGKPAYVQAIYVSANAQAFIANKKPMHREALAEVMRFCEDTLEVSTGGFYSAQSATAPGSASSDYFQWSRDEILERVGDTPESKVLAEYLNAPESEQGLLFATERLQKAADSNSLSYSAATAALGATRKTLASKALEDEKTPPVNKIILSGWSSDLVVAYLDVAKASSNDKAAEFALKSAAFMVEKMVDENRGLARLYYQDQASGYGHLSDNVKFASALLRCHEHTGEAEYLDSAETVMDFIEGHFRDDESGLYRDRMEPGPGILATNALSFREEPCGNMGALAAINWLRIAAARDHQQARANADRILKALEVFKATDPQAAAAQALGNSAQ